MLDRVDKIKFFLKVQYNVRNFSYNYLKQVIKILRIVLPIL